MSIFFCENNDYHVIGNTTNSDSLIIGEHHFNTHGLKTYEKLVFPFQDIVATTDQTIYKYDNDTILRKKIKTHNAVRLTKNDDNYINFFGIDYDGRTRLFLVNGYQEAFKRSEFPFVTEVMVSPFFTLYLNRQRGFSWLLSPCGNLP